MSTGLEIASVDKVYGDRAVLRAASLRVEPGRVRALVGENGAGKSTLIRVACGLASPDAGAVRVDGEALRPGDARMASDRGVGVVHQHFMLVETMTAAENTVLGREPRRGPFGLLFDRARAEREVKALGEKYGLVVDPAARVEILTVGERQRIELLKVLYRGARYVLLDEPTAVLSPGEVSGLLDVVRGLAKAGAGVLFVSHKLDEVLAVADDVTVLRRGVVVLEKPRADVTAAEIARAVVGAEPPAPLERAGNTPGDEVLALRELSARGLLGVSLSVRAGEVLGIAGVEGSGQRVLADAVAGLVPLESGAVKIAGVDVSRETVAQRRARGVGYVPEDREGSGLCAELSVAENLALGDEGLAAGSRRFDLQRARESAREMIERFEIRPANPDAPVASLSGGNAQKVLVARELSRKIKALVIAQPTRGVDLGAAARVHTALREAQTAGVAILLVTSDLDELRALSTRVAVMRGGRVVGEMPAERATDEALGPLMVGA